VSGEGEGRLIEYTHHFRLPVSIDPRHSPVESFHLGEGGVRGGW
jgi:hypothetical protein